MAIVPFFIDYSQNTPITAAFLNSLAQTVYVALGDSSNNPPATAAQVLENLGLSNLLKNFSVVTNVAALRNVNASTSSTVLVLGHDTAGDGGGGVYNYVPTDTSSADNNGTIIVTTDSQRFYWSTNQQLTPQIFGAKGNASNNDTAAIVAADLWARSQPQPTRLWFPGGVYMVSQLPINIGTNWYGDGLDTTEIRQIIGSNTDLIYGVNSNSNWGSVSPAGFPYNFSIEGFTLNGNWNNGAGNTSGNGWAVWGDRCVVRDLFIKNCANWGMRTEYLDTAIDYNQSFFESTFDNIRIDTTGWDGWNNNGPHDQQTSNVTILDAGQALANSYSGFMYGSRFSGRLVSCHTSSRQGSLRMKYSWNCLAGSSGEASGGCNIEGAYTANLYLASQQWIFDPSTRYYASFNGPNIFLANGANSNQIEGYLGGGGNPGTGTIVPIGLQFDTTAGSGCAGNIIKLTLIACNYAAAFTSADAGGNDVQLFGFTGVNVGIAGTPNTTTRVRLNYAGAGPTRFLDTFKQRAQFSVGANTSVTYTWPYAFVVAPDCQITPENPGVVMTNPLWITNNTATSITVFNQNSASVGCSVFAQYGV